MGGGGGNPTGTIITFMGTTAPEGYLVCDGTVYNISDYPLLANHFEAQFQTKNYFGGDGTTTFAVPDLRGEFLRGTGTNSHTNQGSGLNVGMHQDGTIHYMTNTNAQNCIIATDKVDYTITSNRDWVQQERIRIVSAAETFTQETGGIFTSRPTNTSVLYCIKT